MTTTMARFFPLLACTGILCGFLPPLAGCSSQDPELVYKFDSVIQEEATDLERLTLFHQQFAKALSLLQSVGLSVGSDQTTNAHRQVQLSGSTPVYREITVEATILRYVDAEKPELYIHLHGFHNSEEPPDASQDLAIQVHSLFQVGF